MGVAENESYTKRGSMLSIRIVLAFLLLESVLTPTSYSLSIASQTSSAFNQKDKQASEVILNYRAGSMKVESLKDLYVITNSNQKGFLEVIEKLPAGGFGRILRYKGESPNGNWVDLEFVYQDQERSIVIVDHIAGKFYRASFKEPIPNPFAVGPKTDPRIGTDELLATQVEHKKFLRPRSIGVERIQPFVEKTNFRAEAAFEDDLWSKRHIRGPPLEGILL